MGQQVSSALSDCDVFKLMQYGKGYVPAGDDENGNIRSAMYSRDGYRNEEETFMVYTESPSYVRSQGNQSPADMKRNGIEVMNITGPSQKHLEQSVIYAAADASMAIDGDRQDGTERSRPANANNSRNIDRMKDLIETVLKDPGNDEDDYDEEEDEKVKEKGINGKKLPGEGVYRNKIKGQDQENVVFSSRDSAPWVEADNIAANGERKLFSHDESENEAIDDNNNEDEENESDGVDD